MVKDADKGQKRGVDQVLVKEEAKIHIGEVLAKITKKGGVFGICQAGVGQGRCWSSDDHAMKCWSSDG